MSETSHPPRALKGQYHQRDNFFEDINNFSQYFLYVRRALIILEIFKCLIVVESNCLMTTIFIAGKSLFSWYRKLIFCIIIWEYLQMLWADSEK